jgi:hypothetical protein
MTDPNRNGGILNVNFPNSDQVPFHIQTTFTLMDVNEVNSGPELLEAPIDVAYLGQPFFHTPNAFDADGDSIVYELFIPLQGEGIQVPNYVQPNDIEPGPDNTLTLNSETGLLIWDAPQIEGEYNIAFLIKSYRNGVEIDRTIRDMQIIVREDDNLNPDIIIDNSIVVDQVNSVNLGDTVSFTINANDPDQGQNVVLTSTSGLYDYFNQPAQFEFLGGPPFEATFFWVVTAEFLREAPYQVVFKAKDDFSGNGLSTKVAILFKTSTAVSTSAPKKKVINIQAYPNPASGAFLYLDTSNLPNEITSCQLFNVQGQFMGAFVLDPQDARVPIATLPKGVYFLKGTSSALDWSVSFIKE